MRILVESLKRLYSDNKVTDEKLKSMVARKPQTLTEDEYAYITGTSYTA